MKQFLIATLSLLSLVAFGANPSFTDFNANQFGTAGNKVTIKSGVLLTNPVVNSGTITGNGAGLTNLTAANIAAGTNTGLSVAASNVMSGGVLPMGTVASNAGTNGNILMTDGTLRIWSNAPSLATIYPSATLNSLGATNLYLQGNQTNLGRLDVSGAINAGGTITRGNSSMSSTVVMAGSQLSMNGGSASLNSPSAGVVGFQNNGGVEMGRINATALFANAFVATNTVTATNGVFGASGSIILTTNVSVAMAANTYTNVGNYDYTSVFGNVTAATDALTNGTAGRYYIAIHAAFTGAGGASLYEGALFTNAVECTIIEWQRDVSATYGSASASGIITLPANCRVEYKIKSPDAETASFAKLGLTMMGAN